MTNTILIVEDDKEILEYLKQVLSEQGYGVKTAEKGKEALALADKALPDLVLLDIGLPDMDGRDVCRSLKKKYSSLQIILLTARDAPADEAAGLNSGADDYISKPFVSDELIARIHARLRSSISDGAKLKVADLELDESTFEVKRGNRPIHLTSKEFKLLKYLMSNKGRILTREMILNNVWMFSYGLQTRVVDVYMGYLRKKIDASYKKKLIHSVRGFGYVIKE